LESSKSDTSVCPGYSSVQDTLQLKETPLLVGFTDSTWVGDPNDQKFVAGYVFSLGSRPITWACKKQQAISLSSAKAEYPVAVNASQEAL
jgi:hypothetical protein